MEKIYDLIILGGGPAGLSAGLYAGRARLDTVIIEKGMAGGQAATTSDIDNYPGVRNAKGPELSEVMRNQAEDFGTEFIAGDISEVDFSGEIKVVKTSGGEYRGRSVIISTGARPKKLGFPGEKKYTGRGVAYCATCDGEFFTDLEVFVIGAGYAAAEEAIYLTRFAKKVTIIAREPDFTCARSIAERVFENEKIEVIFNTEIVEARGDEMVNYAKFRNNVTKETWEHESGENFGIFVFIGYEPITEKFKGHVKMDDVGYIPTDENMKTDIEGVYAGGDLRPKMLRQIVTAVADGAIAATAAERYVSEFKRRSGKSDAEKSHSKVQLEKNMVKNKKPKFLKEDIASQIRGVFGKMEREVILVTIVDESVKKSLELKEVLEEITELGDKLKLEVYKRGENPEVEEKINADKYPVVAFLDNEGRYRGVKFHGIPGGHELNSFVMAVHNLAGPGQVITPEILEKIKEIDKKVNIKVGVSLTCHHCPDAVIAAQRLAIENENIEAEMIDVLQFADIRSKYNIMSVPAIIINDSEISFGAKKIDEIIEIIKK
ncbi:FAD-dependent oxidoreductase [uncultured Ilyobacter sp.]|uniref:FAD-dependent oxidoreductase n=1 Tax=uncultured Ilyobacter sp. TaxID=544433 RepID=UPI0029F5287B|nr:FAD-dependent oxidoreductase [uncultured Ilyobacter sp.]